MKYHIEDGHNEHYICSPTGKIIATVFKRPGSEKDAALLVAAPELLSQLVVARLTLGYHAPERFDGVNEEKVWNDSLAAMDAVLTLSQG